MVDLIFEGIEFLISGLVTAGSFIAKIISFSFRLSFFVGQLIVNYGLKLLTVFIDVLTVVQTLLQVLCEDCLVFVADVGVKLSTAYRTLQVVAQCTIDRFVNLTLSVTECVNAVMYISSSIALSLFDLISTIISSIFSGVKLLKCSLILLGTTIWDVLLYVPYTVVFLKNATVSFIIQSMTELRHSVDSCRKGFLAVCHFLVKSVSDIPIESLYGLCMGITILYILFKYRHSVMRSSARSVIYLLQQSQSTLVTAWTWLERFTLWLLTNQGTPARVRVEAMQDESEVSSSSSEDEGMFQQHQNPHTQLRLAGMPVTSVAKETKTDLERKLQQEQEERLCVVCQDRLRCTIIMPCRHVCLCYECCGTIKRAHGHCPVCRILIRRTMRVYI